MDDLIAGVAGGAAGGGIANRIGSRRSARNKSQRVLECAFRDPNGKTWKLFKRWRHGRATLSPGVITFVPFVALGLRIKRPFTQPITLQVVSVSNDSFDSPTSEAWSFRGSVRELETDKGTIAWGISYTDDPEWAIEVVLPSQGAS